MLQHYIKIAIRNLLKYKTQSIISIVGLAIGLACFALSTFWVRYELTYDDFHRDADCIYLVRMNDSHFGRHYSDAVPYALGDYLKTTYTEIEDFGALDQSNLFIKKGKQLTTYPLLKPDTAFIRMMDIKVLEGDNHFFLSTASEKGGIAITERAARELFGTTDVIGETITDNNDRHEYRISTLVSDWGEHTNFKYAFIARNNNNTSWDSSNYKMLIKVKPGTDVNTLLDKMNLNFPKELKENRYGTTGYTQFYLTPITSLRYADEFVSEDDRVVRFRYIVYFSIIGVLIILCALVNYLTVYIDRFHSRQREMVLRKVSGASEGSLLALLGTDFFLTILSASFLGMFFVELLKPWFLQYSMIAETDRSIYGNSLLYIVGMSVLAFIVALCSVCLVRRHSLQGSLQRVHGNGIRHICRKGSIVVQLIVCLAFILCTVIMQMQLYHLRNVDMGMNHHNRASLGIWMNVDMNVWAEKLKALPMVTEVVRPVYWPLISMGPYRAFEIDSWDGSDGAIEKPISMDEVLAGEDFFKFYDMQLLAGEWISEKSGAHEVNVMETTVRTIMGWTPEEAIGKRIFYCNKEEEPMTIVGVIKNCAYKSPSADLPNTVFVNTHKAQWMWQRCFVLFKYQPGTWQECRRLIENMQQAEHPDRKLFLDSEAERYDKYLQSEDALSRLLGFSAVVCILISIFGIYSLVSLTCEQRRKEIAIRKVNGATIHNVLHIFLKEYTLLLVVSSLVAFPIGYIVMKQWIETYNRQVNIGLLPFILIFAGIAIVIALSIGWRVWQAARQNPAEVIKNE